MHAISLGLVSEIEQKAGDLTKEEIPFLKAFAYLATLDALLIRRLKSRPGTMSQ